MVTGAASGIGRECTQWLSERGAHVALMDRDESALAALRDKVAVSGGDVLPAPADVTDQAAVVAAVDDMVRRWGGVHGLLNCAGITGTTGIRSHEVELQDFENVMRVNLHGAFVVGSAVIPTMLQQGYGRVVHIASISGKEGNPGMAAYSTSKAALIGLVKVQGKEYAEDGITVNAISPAVVQTPMVAQLPPQQVDYMTSRIPMRRCCTLFEVAEMAGWILSPAASFTTGFTFDLSGGRATY
ncbi:MAG: SDR family oxidoreductase [Pseudonocardiaceae bacterium]|nr:SDR family oxidoreductase [Pseudonocardiaceae bacterium]